jgi:cobyrinic acid a,c-diamide synthase
MRRGSPTASPVSTSLVVIPSYSQSGLRRTGRSKKSCCRRLRRFIYLTRGVEADGVIQPLVGVFPVRTRMLPRRKALGYREVVVQGETIIGPAGTVARGHEFHYSEMERMPDQVERLYSVSRKGSSLGLEGYRYKNCLASYIHLHFGSSPAMAESFVGHCRTSMTRSLT